jgi:energy-converting hydrogenase Eha subunit C
LNYLSFRSSDIDEQIPEQSLRITIKFLNETQKLISANANDTISKIKRLYFADELSNNKIIRFIYQGRELQDSETLHTCNIRDQTIIHCQITTQRHSIPNQINNIDTFSFLDISFSFILFSTIILASIWYLRIKYRVLFTPISTIILILITILFLIITYGPLFSTRRQIYFDEIFYNEFSIFQI